MWTSGCTPSTTFYQPICTMQAAGGATATVDCGAAVLTDGWCRYHPIGSSQSRADVWALGARDIWIVGNVNTIPNSTGGAWMRSAAPFGTCRFPRFVAAARRTSTHRRNSGGTPGLYAGMAGTWTARCPRGPAFPTLMRGLVVFGNGDAMVGWL